ncbi:alpha,alpha-phosphotrehalase [Corynebacterium choanae]|uniref:Trehalose-6-phosphate hydrolase n=1 Tax=Corynebacterium choanae TaxID=1862358 RepID=A0A3G6J7A4_9CORY|nr:alpha,alpha-phosphotrehalase [Corynebacterium choanae]AZA12798.1 Trehalose-6-phosphate hydrolase [Corynebacterium choanae]
MSPRPFHHQVIYQIYPKSFQDSTGDGVGDLRGIIERADYIASLGVDMVWFNPFFVSPGRDNGYDIADYYAIDPAMGTMDDFTELVQALRDRGVGVMLDMVLNHTSTEHEWFQRALAGEQEYIDRYIVRPPQEDGSLPTNWVSKFGGPTWEPLGESGQYYLHLFDVTQADLNWHHPAVREEAARIVNFWRDRGVTGFRFDVINLIGKNTELLDAPAGVDDRLMYTDGVYVDEFLQELNQASFGQDPATVTVGEMSSTTTERCVGYSNPDNHELDMVFSFHHLKVDYENGQKWTTMPADLVALQQIIHDWAAGMQAGGGWNALFWNNHDQPRAINRFGDAGEYREKSAMMLAAMLHLLRGTPFVYMGEEIGMVDPEYTSIDDYVDVEARNAYAALVAAGSSPDDAFAAVLAKARDNARTPMQWDDTPGAGFTTGTPWLQPSRQDEINVKQAAATGEILPFYRKLIALRHDMPLIADGDYQQEFADYANVFGYRRTLNNEQLLVAANMTAETQSITVEAPFIDGSVLIGNYDAPTLAPTMELRPYEVVAVLVDTRS